MIDLSTIVIIWNPLVILGVVFSFPKENNILVILVVIFSFPRFPKENHYLVVILSLDFPKGKS